jgi:hypothetical protein
MVKPNPAPETVADLAGRILVAWKHGQNGALDREVDYATRVAPMHQPDTLEMERMEVLAGAAQSLRSGQQGQVRAAVNVLEQLAHASRSDFRR